jgi:signal transduction histidine kinase
LTNVQRHSGSAAVDIFLTTNNEESAVLSIRDYGRGIPAEKLILFHETGAGVGVGLGGMKQRLRELGGHLLITCDGTGTCVQAKLPIAPVNRIANQVDGDAVQGIPAD